ncbi:MAG TPA: hypothetical protein VKB93_27820 [Thermoanaerobaculia bacterium]|nr:hypothetical protein [Thermoanaerobaculia bacterium]
MRMIVTRSADLTTSSAATAPDSEYEVIYETAPPGGWLGYWGPDVSRDQSVGVRFTSKKTYYLKKIGLWFMNNGLPGVPEVTVTLRDDDNDGKRSIPGNKVFESWTFQVSAHGWNPVLEEMLSQSTPLLDPGTNYWIVCESDARPGEDGVWVNAGEGTGFSTTTNDGSWQDGAEGAVPGTVVRGIQPV